MIVLLRHGRSTWNAEGRFQGQCGPRAGPVGSRGKPGRRPAGWPPCSVPFRCAVWSSDLRRAQATAEITATWVGAGVRLDGRLREVGLGTWEGLSEETAAWRHPAEWRSWKAGLMPRRGRGEDPMSAGRRVAEVLREAMAAPESTVVVGHGLLVAARAGGAGSTGAVEWPGPAPHLGNGELIAVDTQEAPTEVGLALLRY